MIRVKCPKCEKKLAVDDSLVGGVGACPACGQKFRIPGSKAEPAKKPQPAQAKKPTPKAQPGRPKAAEGKTAKPPPDRPKENWDTGSSTPYAVEQVVAAEIPKELRQSMHSPEDADEEGYENVGLDRDYVARKKARKRKQHEGELLPGLSYLTALRLFLGLIWAICIALAFFMPLFIPAGIAVSNLVILAANIWFVVIAFQEDGALHGLLCLFVPFYSLYYLITHWDREKNPFYIGLIGFFMLISFTAVGMFQAVHARGSAAASFAQDARICCVERGVEASPARLIAAW